MKLGPEEYRTLREALASAFGPDGLEELARARLGLQLRDVVPANSTHTTTVRKLIEWAESRSKVTELVAGAREENTTSVELQTAGELVGVSVSVERSLERIVEDDGLVDLVPWREQLGALERQVCSVEVPGGGGTGFLVGPVVVLTNHHVAAPVIDGGVKPADVKVRFDYKRDSDGVTVAAGKVVGLADDWLVDSSPHSKVDTDPAATELPDVKELDYALLRLEAAIGDEPIAVSASDGAPPRGWVKSPAAAPALQTGSIVLILQHPNGEPIKLAQDVVLGVNDNRTRVRYKADTEGGSSGSPVFDIHWNLVALHHSGDPDFHRDATYNEGIPIDMVFALIGERGFGEALG